jgi:hypothetical protein
MPPRFTVRLAFCEAFSLDYAEAEESRYQQTRTPCPVYFSGNDYFTATSSEGREPKANADYQWAKEPSSLNERFGWQLWKAKKS